MIKFGQNQGLNLYLLHKIFRNPVKGMIRSTFNEAEIYPVYPIGSAAKYTDYVKPNDIIT